GDLPCRPSHGPAKNDRPAANGTSRGQRKAADRTSCVRFLAAILVRAGDNEAMTMTEQEWLACDDAFDMLFEPLCKAVGHRKLGRLVCACCGGIWDLMTEPNRSTVELAERYAYGLISKEELAAKEHRCRMYRDVDEPVTEPEDQPPSYWCDLAAWKVT